MGHENACKQSRLKVSYLRFINVGMKNFIHEPWKKKKKVKKKKKILSQTSYIR